MNRKISFLTAAAACLLLAACASKPAAEDETATAPAAPVEDVFYHNIIYCLFHKTVCF